MLVLADAIAPLGDMFQVSGGIGALVGGTLGFAFRATTDRAMLENVALGTALGAFAGTAVGAAMWIGSVAA